MTHEGIKFNSSPNKILVKVESSERVTKSGIIIPDTVDARKDFKGTVVAMSPYILESNVEPKIKIGDKVIMRRNSGVKVPMDDKENEYRIYTIGELLYDGF